MAVRRGYKIECPRDGEDKECSRVKARVGGHCVQKDQGASGGRGTQTEPAQCTLGSWMAFCKC